MGDTKFTPQQVVEALQKVYSDNDEGYLDWDEIFWDADSEPLQTDIGPIRAVDSEGGEGQGDYAHVVIETVRSGQLFKVTGYYSSYEGTDYSSDDLFEAHRVTREVVFYE